MTHTDIEGVSELMTFYKTLEDEIDIARSSTNFYCIEGCGACCFTPAKNLEASIFEAIPIALALIEQGIHETILDQIERGDDKEAPCVLYAKKTNDGQQGGCIQYASRPLICRLFGSSKKSSKNFQNTQPLPIVCKQLKAIHFDNSEKVTKLIGLLPMATTVSDTARSLNPQLSDELFSINEAIRRALHYILQRIYYETNQH